MTNQGLATWMPIFNLHFQKKTLCAFCSLAPMLLSAAHGSSNVLLILDPKKGCKSLTK